MRRSTKPSGSGSSISERESSSSKSSKELERPPSRSGNDSSARERLAEAKVDKYKVLVDEAKTDAARSRTKLEEAEKEIKALKKALEDASYVL